MALYFSRPQRSQRPEQLSLQLADSIYVFPNPPSASPSPLASAPASPLALGFSTPTSELSAPTDFAYSASAFESGLTSPRSKSRESRLTLSPPLGGTEIEIWDWTLAEGEDDESIILAASPGLERDRWELLLHRRQQSLKSLQSTSQNSFENRHSASPHPRIHIPLLSFLVSLLSIEDPTVLHLLSHSSSQSTLFPGHTLCPNANLSLGTATVDVGDHGILKLLRPSRGSESHGRILKEGCAVACNPAYMPVNPFIVPGLRLVWGLVSGVITNGGKAFREVWNGPGPNREPNAIET